MRFEQQAMWIARLVIDAYAEHQHQLGQRLLAALDAGDLDEIRYTANDLVGYGEQPSDARFNNAIG